jgi:Holliday junction resolvase RusA-like endonuclease
MEFKLVFEFKSINDVINDCKKHWSKYSKVKHKTNELIALQTPKLNIDYPIDILFEWHLKDKRRDHDNIAFNKKYVLDGMTQKGAITTDRQSVVKNFKDIFVYDTKEDYVIVKITNHIPNSVC